MNLSKRRFVLAGSVALLCSLRSQAAPVETFQQLVAPGADIVLGQSAPLTGEFSALGNRMHRGATAYFSALNDAGGINGRRVRLIVMDDGGKTVDAQRNTEKFLSRGVFSLFGYGRDASAIAAMPAVESAKVPLVGAMDGGAGLRKQVNPLVFNVRASYSDEIEKQVQEIVASGAHRIGIVYQDDEFGRAGLEAARVAIRRRGFIPVVVAKVKTGSTDVSQALPAVATSRPSAVILIAPSAAPAIIIGLREQGIQPLLYHLSFINSLGLVQQLGKFAPGVLVTQVTPFPWSPSIPIVKEYQAAMLKLGESEFDFASLEGYIAARVAGEGLLRSGSNLSRSTFVQGLESIENTDFGGYVVNFHRSSRSGSRLVETTMIGNKGAFIR